ncbi:MAG: alpha-D-glucose phosphate-specific phosphoglucomutase [Acidobacteria bacterium]|nr:alpha-D-glucose phosphate-specific phosphoglucomutase [Acidobacteriota bacterium]
MDSPTLQIIASNPFSDQRPGTSGLRKKTRVFMQPHYLENFVQSVFNAVREKFTADFSQETLVVGGDGRYYNRRAIQIILRLAVANGFGKVMIGQGGILSTPAASAVIRRRGALGGLVLSASHNPGGIDADFGIKYNIRNGGPAPEAITEAIYQHTLKLANYLTTDLLEIDLDTKSSFTISNTQVTIFDPLEDYTAIMEELFDFAALKSMFAKGFKMRFDAMHAVTGPYAHHILEKLLGAPSATVVNGIPKEDFAQGHPDPNLVYAEDLVKFLYSEDAPDFGAASDGDGDRNLILGKSFFVTPGDSLAIIAEYAQSAIPGYSAGLSGIARSMPTSTAADRVAKALGVNSYETPTGWKFFGNLMDADKCTICGEESFGTGSNHVREKDGLWAVLCWLSILAHTGKSVVEVVESHWQKFGRSYYQRYDFEGIDSNGANKMIANLREKLPSLPSTPLADTTINQADDFSYTDPVDSSLSTKQGLRLLLADGSRIIFRLSGTGTEGATLRIYFERYKQDGGKSDINEVLKPLIDAAKEILKLKEFCGVDEPTVIT